MSNYRKHFFVLSCSHLLKTTTTLQRPIHPHLTEEMTEAQRHQVTCLGYLQVDGRNLKPSKPAQISILKYDGAVLHKIHILPIVDMGKLI